MQVNASTQFLRTKFVAPIFPNGSCRVTTWRILVLILLAASTTAGAGAADGIPVWGVAVFPSGAEFGLEIVADDRSRARGYMFRDHVAVDEGMFFIFDEPKHHSFWMKNCRVALDIIFLDDSFTVVDIALEKQPCKKDEVCESILPMIASRYVLEVAAGRAVQEGLQRGDRLTLLTDPPIK